MSECEEILDLQTNKPKLMECRKSYVYHDLTYTIKDTKLKKSILNSVDTLISILIIGPLVVGFWRGTWGIMDLYPHYFPHYESLVFSNVIHLCFLLSRQFIKDYVDRDENRVKKEFSFVIFRRVHSYVYAVICTMQWRGIWKTFDHIIDFRPEDDPLDKVEWTLVIFLSSLLLLAVLKSLRNAVAAPLVVVFDTSDSPFNFPTRFKVSILYLINCIFILEYGVLATPIQTKEQPTDAIAPQNLYKAHLGSVNATKTAVDNYWERSIKPHPFQSNLMGSTPASFVANADSSLVKTSVHRRRHYPKNIQEIIDQIGEESALDARNENHIIYMKPQPSPVNMHAGSQDTRTFALGTADPFFTYKPKDPSDVNLLATNNVRFAPPVWANFKPKQVAADVSTATSLRENEVNPLKVTLSIYPNKNFPRFQNIKYYPKTVDYNTQNLNLAEDMRRMVVHLNVYPIRQHRMSGGRYTIPDIELPR